MTLSSLKGTRMGRWTAFARLHDDRRGVAAVEFALILPILIMLFLGLNEVQPAYSIKQKLGLTTRAVADLSTRKASLTMTELATILAAAKAIMRPYSTTDLQIVVSSVAVDADTLAGKVSWSCRSGPSKSDDMLPVRIAKDPYTVPEEFKTVDSSKKAVTKSFILVEVRYPYDPKIGYMITNTIQFNDSIAWPVRDADSVDYKDKTCPAST